MSEAKQHKEIILSVLVNTIKYHRVRIEEPHIPVEEPQKDIVDFTIGSLSKLIKVQEAFKWLWLEWRGKAISPETVNECEPETSIKLLIDTYPELIDRNELEALTLSVT